MVGIEDRERSGGTKRTGYHRTDWVFVVLLGEISQTSTRSQQGITLNMTLNSYDRRPAGSSVMNMPASPHRLSSGDHRTKPMAWPGKSAARDSGISMASMSLSPEPSPRDSFFKNSLRDSGISMSSPRDSFFKNSLRDSGIFPSCSAQAIPEEAAWTQIRSQQEEEDLVLIEEEEEDEEDIEALRQRMRQRDSGILSRSESLSSTVPPTPSTLVSSTAAAEQLADEATTMLLMGDWSTTSPKDEIPALDDLVSKGGALNATAHLPVAMAPPACATIEAEEDEEAPGRGGIVTISPLRVALHNYTQARTSLCQGNMDVLIQKDTFLHLVERGADFWTRLSKHNNDAFSSSTEDVAPECLPRRRGSSVFEDLIGFTSQHYAGGPSFSLPLVKAMIEKEPRRLSAADLIWAFEKLAACGSLGSVDVPVGRYLLSLPGVTPQRHYVSQFRLLDESYLRGEWRARGRQLAGRRFAEECDEF